MANITINRSHNLSEQEIKTKLDLLADKMSSRFDLDCGWKNEQCMSFKRSGVDGDINLQDNNINLEIKLGMMMGAFKGVIEQEINQFLDKEIG